MSPKKLISMIFWIRKNKGNRLTCKNIFYDRKYLKIDINYVQKHQYNIYIYIFFYLLYPLKYTNEAAIGQSEELVRQRVFENSLNILQL